MEENVDISIDTFKIELTLAGLTINHQPCLYLYSHIGYINK